jgi:prepilin signal peptidase PulO-like enzyme (type II secretory pathway)
MYKYVDFLGVQMDCFTLFFGALIGALFGSYAHVISFRAPKMWSTWRSGGDMTVWFSKPDSACPSCNHKLSWYENMPIFGWLFLRGKCRHCGAKIHIKYFAWEVVWSLAGGVIALISIKIYVSICILFLLATIGVEIMWRLFYKKWKIAKSEDIVLWLLVLLSFAILTIVLREVYLSLDAVLKLIGGIVE